MAKTISISSPWRKAPLHSFQIVLVTAVFFRIFTFNPNEFRITTTTCLFSPRGDQEPWSCRMSGIQGVVERWGGGLPLGWCLQGANPLVWFLMTGLCSISISWMSHLSSGLGQQALTGHLTITIIIHVCTLYTYIYRLLDYYSNNNYYYFGAMKEKYGLIDPLPVWFLFFKPSSSILCLTNSCPFLRL